MTFQLLNLSRPRSEAGDLPGLHAALTPLVGEPFRFARVSYGDELTLHFGDLRPARSPKLKNLLYGAYVLGLRGSRWVVKAGTAPLVRSSTPDPGPAPGEGMTLLTKTEIEANPLVAVGSRVLDAEPFRVLPRDSYGLLLRFSDGSVMYAIPASPETAGEPDDLPELADWELNTPNGLLSAGPGLTWEFRPKSAGGPNSPSPGALDS
ncbi:MAG TPA: hypothetical protein VH092_21995 [Urbifossiella sp.]|jgi:hypothetical protein|nr:hypothetical protein [Urbifossiella sp.]